MKNVFNNTVSLTIAVANAVAESVNHLLSSTEMANYNAMVRGNNLMF